LKPKLKEHSPQKIRPCGCIPAACDLVGCVVNCLATHPSHLNENGCACQRSDLRGCGLERDEWPAADERLSRAFQNFGGEQFSKGTAHEIAPPPGPGDLFARYTKEKFNQIAVKIGVPVLIAGAGGRPKIREGLLNCGPSPCIAESRWSSTDARAKWDISHRFLVWKFAYY